MFVGSFIITKWQKGKYGSKSSLKVKLGKKQKQDGRKFSTKERKSYS